MLLRKNKSITLHLKNLLLDKNEEGGKTKYQVQFERKQRQQTRLDSLRAEMTIDEKRQIDANVECGVSNWLTTIPLKEWGYDLNKQKFWDAIRIRYNWNLERLPTDCICGEKFNLSHALSCKKGGMVTLRHNELRDITATLLKEICHDVRTEPPLVEVNGGSPQRTDCQHQTRSTPRYKRSRFLDTWPKSILWHKGF